MPPPPEATDYESYLTKMNLYVCHYQTYEKDSVQEEVREFKSLPRCEEIAFTRSRKDYGRNDEDVIVNAICQPIPCQSKNYYFIPYAYRSPEDARSRRDSMRIFCHKNYIYAVEPRRYVDGISLFFVVGDETVSLGDLEGEPEDFSSRREIFRSRYSWSLHSFSRDLLPKIQKAYDEIEKVKSTGQSLRLPVACFSVICAGEPFYVYPNDFLPLIGALSPLFDPLVLTEDRPHFILPDFCRPLNNRALLGWWLTTMKGGTVPHGSDLLCRLSPTLEHATEELQALADFCHYFAIEYYQEYLEQLLS